MLENEMHMMREVAGGVMRHAVSVTRHAVKSEKIQG